MSGKYSLNITQTNGDTPGAAVVDVLGSLNVVSYAAKDSAKDLAAGTEYRIEIGTAERADAFLALTADAETVTEIAKTRIGKLRKSERSAGTPAVGE